MKKTLIFLVLALLTLSVAAQEKKSVRKDILRYGKAEQDSLIMKSLEDAMSLMAARGEENPQRSAPATLWSYDVGSIPYSQDVTPTGARTVTVPIATVPSVPLAPQVALTYNSQAGNDVAGYGWGISGLPTITITNKTIYFDDAAYGADINDTTAVYMLDGVRLVRNTNTEYPDYEYETASGHILVKKHRCFFNIVSHFSALYPDGSRATFGNSDNTFESSEFPLTEIIDRDGNRIECQYYHDIFDGKYYISDLSYSYSSQDEAIDHIHFTYDIDDRRDVVEHFYGVQRYYQSRILRSIESYCSEDLLRSYTLTHEMKDSVNILTRIDCSEGSSAIPPLRFGYGDEGYEVRPVQLRNVDNILMPTAFTDTTANYIYVRGKFVPGAAEDGLVVLPNFPTYDIVDSYFLYAKYGSPYPGAQHFAVIPSIRDGYCDVDIDTILAGEGFQTIQAVDVDADGTDELVKVNFNGASGNSHTLKITTYKYSLSGSSFSSSSFNVSLSGNISDYFKSPYQRAYYWGDFTGTGKAQLLTIAFSMNVYNEQQTCYAALIDLAGQAKLSESVIFDFPISDAGNVFTMDVDNDSRTELCRATSSGLQMYRLGSGNTFSLKTTDAAVTSSVLSNSSRPAFIADLNGDGYLDILSAPASGSSVQWDYYMNKGGHRFFYKGTMSCVSRSAGDEFMFMDVNFDGLADMIKASSAGLQLYLNRNGTIQGTCVCTVPSVTSTKGIVPCNVMDPYGASAFLKVDGFYLDVYSFSHLSPVMRQMTSMTDSFGAITQNTYEYLGSPDGNYLVSSDYTPSVSAGFMKKTVPFYLLKEEHRYKSSALENIGFRQFWYYDCTFNNLGLGFCGFRKVRTVDGTMTPVIFAETVYGTEQRGVVLSSNIRYGSLGSNPAQTVSNTYDANTTTYGKLNPRLTQSISYNNVTGVRDTTKYSACDAYDFPETVYNSKSTSSSSLQTTNTTFTYSHSTTASLYLLGSVSREMTSFQNDGNDDDIWSEETVTTFDAKKHPTRVMRYVGLAVRDDGTLPLHGKGDGDASEDKDDGTGDNLRAEQPVTPVFPPGPIDPLPSLLLPIADKLVSDTKYTYNSWGHVTSETTAMYGAEEYVGNTYEYDEDGRFLHMTTDALGRATTYSGYTHYGQPANATDWLSRTTVRSYDTWGNPTGKTLPDGSSTTVSRSWVTSGPGLYCVSTSGNDGTQRAVFYDSAGREIRRSARRFDGDWTNVDTEYDARGKVSRVSLPFTGASAASGTAAQWTTYTYDAYSRPTAITEPSFRRILWNYNGLSTVETKDLIATTRTTDASGRLVSVTDPGGTITYSLRDDGQPLSVTAPGSVTTSFTYDGWGRRTGITDPSAGTRTWAYVQNADGSSSVTETNPKGTVSTYSDKYGRLTQVVRSGQFNTVYAYGTYGQLQSERSTNGTSRTYTYDAYDRPLEVTDSIPDGKWLRSHFAYDNTGVLASTAFTSQDGAITTEYYAYAHGHKVRTMLPDSTIVWQLDSANVFGQPTQATTGNLTRTYSFTQYGLPSGRGFGAYQQYTYSFDNLTGNLSSRSDGEGHTETFSYDTYGRLLTYTGGIYSSYDTYGNILRFDSGTTMQYGNTSHPYLITSATFDSSYPDLEQTVSYTCFNRPSHISQGDYAADFTYDGNAGRVRMQVTDESGSVPVSVLTRYYLGDRLEMDVTPAKTTERFYLDGTPYSAPMVMVRDSTAGAWTLYNIGRDYLGSITDIACASDSTFHLHYSYTPWGLQQDLGDAVIYSPEEDYLLFLGRGFTGHEHLPWFGLINMNARLYDPVLGRFLSPDPYVQAPDDTRNYNRYSYALNNPLKYTDESGEIVWLLPVIIGAIVGTYIGGVMANNGDYNPIDWDYNAGKTWNYMIGGAIFGGLSGLFGWAVASSGIPMANTAGLMSASFVNSVGTNFYTGGATPVSISFGVASYDLTNNSWGYLGKKGNKWYENLGYGLGAMANLMDINQLINSTSAILYTDNSDFISHSAIVEEDGNTLMSFGPNDSKIPNSKLGFATYFRKGTSDYKVYTTLPVEITVNKHIFTLTRGLGKLLPYQGITTNCVNMASLSLWLNGIPNIGLHPYLLYATTWAYSSGIRSDILSYYLTNIYIKR